MLVYDVATIDGATIGDDVRDLIERRPCTHSIYVLAPYLSEDVVEVAIRQGTPLQRASAIGVSSLTEVFLIGIRIDEKFLQVATKRFSLHDDKVVTNDWEILSSSLIDGWLFNLFDRNNGLVNAPIGVHFSKASGKHASKFLRTSSILLSSEACGVVAFFSLGALSKIEPRRIFVDTAPLLSLAFALQRVAAVRGIWSGVPPSKSFSSYGGVNDALRLGKSDLVLISASTSGGLANRLIELGASPTMILTLYVLKSNSDSVTAGTVLCDLTFSNVHGFGYPPIDNQPASTCFLCSQGYVLAELEGDQFLLEKRAVKRLRVGSASQSLEARKVAEVLARNQAIKVHLQKSDRRKTDIVIDVCKAMDTDIHWQRAFARSLTRFVPVPINYIVIVGIAKNEAASYFQSAGMLKEFETATVVEHAEVSNLAIIANGNAVVLAPFLCDHALLRGINAQLRPKLEGGCVSYVAALTIADSARNLSDLRIFLQYGEHGPETFIFRSALEFMLPWSTSHESPWTAEFSLLQQIQNQAILPVELESRLNFLRETALSADHLFLQGLEGELSIKPDFVLLDTKDRRQAISQADIFAVVSNCLAAARCNNVGLNAKVSRENPTPIWRQTVFGQSVLCPSNFRDFNDAVLRASLLRAADVQELNYCVDEVASEEMLDVIRADLNSWTEGKGDSLPEFLLSIACRRLRLLPSHLVQLSGWLNVATLPLWLKAITDANQNQT